MAEDKSGFSGPFDVAPDDVVPVGAFGFGFGNISGVDEEGVRSHPVVILLTNEGQGPSLMFDAMSVQPLVTGLMGAGLKAMTQFDPKLKEVIGEHAGDDMFAMLSEMEKTSDERLRAKEDKATNRVERLQLVYGLAIVLLGLALLPFWGVGWFLFSVFIYFAVQGFTANAVRGFFTLRRWRRERREKRAQGRPRDDVDHLQPPE